MRKNKYKYFYVIKGHSVYGTEDIDQFDTYKEARQNLKEYRLSMPSFSLTIVKRREINKD